ncbi:hypothetical protein BS50DRAFT_280765 [Corynespora cassiicola Philippines]|uniref:Uncharacterized protein n=1 Tax=Corynespora cassiicola Philippines TaxID=1448308 RepID=A0A2T2P113_CORCC|nr:hypothetical protein BS50DRAFT_280765 [Corynespora cassiicola Philippines]
MFGDLALAQRSLQIGERGVTCAMFPCLPTCLPAYLPCQVFCHAMRSEAPIGRCCRSFVRRYRYLFCLGEGFFFSSDPQVVWCVGRWGVLWGCCEWLSAAFIHDRM